MVKKLSFLFVGFVIGVLVCIGGAYFGLQQILPSHFRGISGLKRIVQFLPASSSEKTVHQPTPTAVARMNSQASSEVQPTQQPLAVKINDFYYKINRSILNKRLSNLPHILQQAKVLPHKDSKNKIVGYRFDIIKQHSIFTELGFKKDDILKEVNGSSISNPQQAINLYAHLSKGSKFEVEITRRGKTLILVYEVISGDL